MKCDLLSKLAPILLFLALASCDTKPQKEALTQSLKAFNEAFATADSAALSSMITDNYSHINGSSRPYSGQEWLSYVASQRQKMQRGQLIVEEYTMTQIEIDTYGNSAVITGLVTRSGSEDGRDFVKKFQVTHLWVFDTGSWKRAAFHDGRVK